MSVSVDMSGAVCVTGSIVSSSIEFGNYNLSNNSNSLYSDIFIVKYDPFGNVIWAKSAGGQYDDYAQSSAIDDANNIYIVGYAGSTSTAFGNIILGQGGFLAKISEYEIPDIIIENASLSATSVEAGLTITAQCDVTNLGEFTLGESEFRLYLSADEIVDAGDVDLGSVTISGVAPEGSYNINETITIPETVTPGDYYILLVADADNVIEELIEDNNLSSLAITITEPTEPTLPDLMITDRSLSPASVYPGETVEITANVYNNGGESGEFSVKYYLSENTTYDASDVLLGESSVFGLWAYANHSESETLTIPVETSAGFWSLIYYADADDEVTESNETNNTNYGAIEILSTGEGIDNQLYSDNIRIYPNPSDGSFTIEVNNAISGISEDEHIIEVYNFIGEVILTEKIEFISCKYTINMYNQPQGIYVIKLQNSKATIYKTIVIE